MPARIFLYTIAALIFLAVGAAIAWNVFQDEILEIALVPNEPVEILDAVQQSEYAARNMWLVRPDIENPPSAWMPENYDEIIALSRPGVQTPLPGDELYGEATMETVIEQSAEAEGANPLPRVPVFYVLPTTYLKRDRWNAPLRDPSALRRQRLFAASQASAFTQVGDIWAPLYRQAVLGAFLTTEANADVAIRYAYRDVEAAFDYFLAEIGEDQPFILAGHSQGSLHIKTLLHERIADTPIADRVVAAYLIGWPLSVQADLPALPLPACEAAGQPSCIYSFISFAEPAEPRQVERIYEESVGLTQEPRRGTDMLCINPLTGEPGGEALADTNIGALRPTDAADDAELIPGLIPARCGPRGLLLIGRPPEGYDRYVLPGNNYHVFDYMLFWANIRADVERRTRSFFAARG